MKSTVIDIPKMDCPSEERLIRMALEPEGSVRQLVFDLDAHRLTVRHDGDVEAVLRRLEPLGFGARLVATEEAVGSEAPASSDVGEARVLKQLLAINAAMFVVELVLGLVAQSAGLMADSLDMFADAAVYGMSLYAVGRARGHQRRAAWASGLLQMVLAVGMLVEVARRAVVGSEPIAPVMMAVSTLALVANVTCMALLAKHRTGGVHMKASWIFSTNDVLANLGVIVAGVLVALLGTSIPDLVIGTLIGLVVLAGSFRILRLTPNEGVPRAD